MSSYKDFLSAMSLAKEKHCGQMYGDRDYVTHLEEVADRVVVEASYMVLCVAYLHDILEDTDCEYEDLIRIFGLKVADAVLAMTKQKGESYADYINKVKKNKIALLVKKADTFCNLRQSVKNDDARRIKKYAKQLIDLEE